MRAAGTLVLAALLFAGPALADELAGARQEFRAAQKSDNWKDRQDAYVVMAGYDSRAAAEEVLQALVKEENAAVVYTGVRSLAQMKSTGAQEAYKETLLKGKPLARRFVLMALDSMSAAGLTETMHEVLKGKDAGAAAQAAMALGRRRSYDSIPHLLPLLKHKAWQVRRGAAVALLALASPHVPAAKPEGKKGEKAAPSGPPAPDEVSGPEVVKALVAALAQSQGVERTPMWRALKRITRQDYGLDHNAWKQLAAGKDPAQIVHKPAQLPHIFGIPILGRRVVIVFDRSLRMNEGHPYRGKRMEDLCAVPGGRHIPWMRLHRARTFAGAHVKRLFNDMEKKSRLEIVLFHKEIGRVFGKFVSNGAASKKLLKETLKDLPVSDGLDTYGALTTALDIAGAKDAKAWKSGPDEIVFITVNIPTTGEVTDPDVLASAIGLKARLRMVPVHTIGIKTHPYDMLRQIAAQSGGIYRNYHE